MRKHYQDEFDKYIAQKLLNHKAFVNSDVFFVVIQQLRLRKWWEIGYLFSYSVFFSFLLLFGFDSLNRDLSLKNSSSSLENNKKSTEPCDSFAHRIASTVQSFAPISFTYPSAQYPVNSPLKRSVSSTPILLRGESSSLLSDIGQASKSTQMISKSQTPNELSEAHLVEDTLFQHPAEAEYAEYFEDLPTTMPDSASDIQKVHNSKNDSLEIKLEPVSSKKPKNQRFGISLSGFCTFKHQVESNLEPSFAQRTFLKDRMGFSAEFSYSRKISRYLNLQGSIGVSHIFHRTWLEVNPKAPKPSFLRANDSASTWIVPKNTDWNSTTLQTDLLRFGIGLQYRIKGNDKWFIGSEVVVYQSLTTSIKPHTGLRASFGRNFGLGGGYALTFEPEFNYFYSNYKVGFLNSRPYSLALRLTFLRLK